jgi:hypothetical protein
MTPPPAAAVLDAFYLDARSRILDLAATLDRIDRGGGTADPRLGKLLAGIERLLGAGDRAEAVQHLFSLDYDPGWKLPCPR